MLFGEACWTLTRCLCSVSFPFITSDMCLCRFISLMFSVLIYFCNTLLGQLCIQFPHTSLCDLFNVIMSFAICICASFVSKKVKHAESLMWSRVK